MASSVSLQAEFWMFLFLAVLQCFGIALLGTNRSITRLACEIFLYCGVGFDVFFVIVEACTMLYTDLHTSLDMLTLSKPVLTSYFCQVLAGWAKIRW